MLLDISIFQIKYLIAVRPRKNSMSIIEDRLVLLSIHRNNNKIAAKYVF